MMAADYSIERDITQALLPAARYCWELAGRSELSEYSLVGSWDTAAVDHFKSITPRAYMRTGALTTVSPVAAKVMGVTSYNNQFVADVVFTITDEKSATWHQEAQTPGGLSERDIDDIKHPKKGKPLVYPFLRNPQGNVESRGISGSWHKQEHDYLQYYLFAGPNVKSSPRVYRSLGGADGQDPQRGLDLFNRWMSNTGFQAVTSLPKDGSNRVNAQLNNRTDTDMSRLINSAAAMLQSSITITADFTPYRLELE